jgi:phosphorylcholine metabolism protein LicD
MIYDDKVRLRSDEELETQNEGLIILKNSLTELNIKYFLAAGTLLGAIREKNFIRWDWDVQLYLLVENAYPLKEKISELLVHKGFEINNHHESKNFLKWDINRKNVKYELTGWNLEGKWRHRRGKKMMLPAYLFDGEYIINFKGNNYPTLNPPEDYLEFCYGDWKTPIRTSDKRIYTTSRHWRNNTAINRLIIFLKKYVKKFISFFNNREMN